MLIPHPQRTGPYRDLDKVGSEYEELVRETNIRSQFAEYLGHAWCNDKKGHASISYRALLAKLDAPYLIIIALLSLRSKLPLVIE